MAQEGAIPGIIQPAALAFPIRYPFLIYRRILNRSRLHPAPRKGHAGLDHLGSFLVDTGSHRFYLLLQVSW